jgi:hypothetical protein
MLVNTAEPAPDTCVICFEMYTKETSILFQCSHQICIVCYEKLINQHNTVHCPLCREIVESVETEHIPQPVIVEPPSRICHWASLYCRELICYSLLLGGLSLFFIK